MASLCCYTAPQGGCFYTRAVSSVPSSPCREPWQEKAPPACTTQESPSAGDLRVACLSCLMVPVPELHLFSLERKHGRELAQDGREPRPRAAPL